MNTRVVFMGSPDFALPTLVALINEYDVIGIVTQPDRPAGRGREITSPPVKKLADQFKLPFIQPLRLRDPQALEQLQTWAPELIVVAAFGQILRQDILNIPSHGCINVHASLLPCWRGAAPIQASILNGDLETGVTIIKMDAGIDTGPLLSQRVITILPDDTAGTLSQRLANVGAGLLIETLPDYLNLLITPQTQPEGNATYSHMLEKKDGLLDFQISANKLSQRVRAFNPWPGAYTILHGKVLIIHMAHPIPGFFAEAGMTTVYQGLPAIGTADGLLVLDEVQLAGKRSMLGKDFLSGAREWRGH